ncbi:FAD-dependent monooxygenase [Labrys sp. LIt4]|nr:FAD-dependent monooxygenase [Labrys sp. LIt4]
MTRRPLHVVIIGAGLGGLCLAQGLRQQGISFDVYERDEAADSRTQGYRIRIDETGQQALAACLTPELNQLFRQTCAVSHSDGRFLDTQLGRVEGRPSGNWRPSAVGADPSGDGDLSANRLTLREILLCGIEDHVHFGKAFRRFDARNEAVVTIGFEDGTACEADILVAADGVNSTVRRQCLPLLAPKETGAVCIYGKSLLPSDGQVADTLLDGTSVIFADDFAVIVDAMTFRFPLAAAGLTPIADYLYWAVIGRRTSLGLDEAALREADGEALAARVQYLARSWTGGLRALFAEADRSTIAALAIRSADALPAWTPSRVTMLGDAIHAMSPAGGVGANTALDDAAHLATWLSMSAIGKSTLATAIAAYEDDLRRRANRAIAASLQGAHRLFGDGTAI